MSDDLIAHPLHYASAYLAFALSSKEQVLAHVAVIFAMVMATTGALSRTMVPLRWMAAASNLGLMVYGALHPSLPTLLISAVLLPINVYRAVEITRLTHRVNRAGLEADQAGLWLKPYMKARKLRAGQELFKMGDQAEHLYLLIEGEMELVELAKPLERGRIFGEIALFSPTGLRTMTARCVTKCTVLQIHESTVKQLYYQNPSFGFHLIDLLAGRLSADVARAHDQIKRLVG
jgi:CRP-like cAMP-binding protein